MAKKGNTKTVGIVLLVVGVVLLAAGANELGAFGSRLGRALGGGIQARTLAMLIGGGVCAVLGINKLR